MSFSLSWLKVLAIATNACHSPDINVHVIRNSASSKKHASHWFYKSTELCAAVTETSKVSLKKKVNRLFKSQVAATSQTQWVAFTYPALTPQQDLWQILFMAAAQGAVLHFHSLGAVCFDITSLPFPLIWYSRSGRAHKSRGVCLSRLAESTPCTRTLYLVWTKSTMTRAWPTPTLFSQEESRV